MAGSLRDELLAAQEEAGGWQRRCKQLQGEADGRELELARRGLQSKVRRWPVLGSGLRYGVAGEMGSVTKEGRAKVVETSS